MKPLLLHLTSAVIPVREERRRAFRPWLDNGFAQDIGYQMILLPIKYFRDKFVPPGNG